MVIITVTITKSVILISSRSWPWWMITKANKDIANRKHTYLFYGNVNCTSKAKAYDSVQFSSAKWVVDPGLYASHVICAWLSFQLSQIMLYCASFESYIWENLGFSLTLASKESKLKWDRQRNKQVNSLTMLSCFYKSMFYKSTFWKSSPCLQIQSSQCFTICPHWKCIAYQTMQ